MKVPFGTALSIAGVLVAGVAAAAVNTQALQSRADSTVGEATASLVVDAQVTNSPTPSATPTPVETVIQYVTGTSTDSTAANDSNAPASKKPKKVEPTQNTNVEGTATVVTDDQPAVEKSKSNHEDDDGEDEGED